jgi:hypothetical protein
MATSLDLGILSMLEISRTDTNFRLSVACEKSDKEEPVLSIVFSEGANEFVLSETLTGNGKIPALPVIGSDFARWKERLPGCR